MAELKLLTKHQGEKDTHTIAHYKSVGGYTAVKKSLCMKPEEIVAEVKASGLRGRGGAGFPTGMKWSFIPKVDKPKYLLCNADEGEPGTFKDRVLLEEFPHTMIEGMIIAAKAIDSHQGYIYIRGEYHLSYDRVQAAVDEAYAAGLLGKNILGTGYNFELSLRID